MDSGIKKLERENEYLYGKIVRIRRIINGED